MTKLIINTSALWQIEQENDEFSLYCFSAKIYTSKSYAQILEHLFTALEKAEVPMEFNCLPQYANHESYKRK